VHRSAAVKMREKGQESAPGKAEEGRGKGRGSWSPSALNSTG
jgi:hypothetical protein